MERRLNKRINEHIHMFKTAIVEQLQTLSNNENKTDLSRVIKFVYDYEKFEFDKEDFVKRKRSKNMVPMYERCCAKRASGEQCTRRKKDESEYCGTHSKGTPHGIITDIEPKHKPTKIEVSAIDIKGIVYYLDNFNNVYDPEDIISNINNPRIIAKYEKEGGVYTIPELFSN